LKMAMVASGYDTPTALAKRCGVSRQTVVNWLAMDKAMLSAESLGLIAKCLEVRMTWLIDGEGTIGSQSTFRAIKVLDRLDASAAEEWLAIGERMG
jgi:transcriptional regulator with XRE-family HTH domain